MATRIPEAAKARAMGIFEEDLKEIGRAMTNQLQKLYSQIKKEVEDSCGVTEKRKTLEGENDRLTALKREHQRVSEDFRVRIEAIEKSIERQEEDLLGDLAKDVSVDDLRDLGFTEEDSPYHRRWNGFPVENALEAKICLLMMSRTDVNAPAYVLKRIAKAVERELAFAGSYEAVEEAYEKFYALDFQKYGVDIPPRLVHIAALSGNSVLQLGLREEKAVPALPPMEKPDEL